jgi:hypothetical protein
MERGGAGGRAALQMLILLGEKRSMVMQRVTPRRTAIRKLQDRCAKEFDAGDTHSDSWPEDFDRGPSNSPRLKPTLPKIAFLERPDLSKL